MSDAYIKKFERKYHDEHQVPAPDKTPKERSTSRKHQSRPWTLWHKWSCLRGHLPPFLTESSWHRWGRYRTKKEAEVVMAKEMRAREGLCNHLNLGSPDRRLRHEWKIEKE